LGFYAVAGSVSLSDSDSNIASNQKQAAETSFIIANNMLAKAKLGSDRSSDVGSDSITDDSWMEVV